ncbi:MAG: STAS domain-containing protein [Phycisphaerales bacterium]
MSDTSLQINIETIGETIVVTPNGDIDLSKSTELRAKLQPLLSQQPEKLIVDLNAVPYMDSSGLATLIEALQITRQQGKTFVLCDLSEGVQSIIALSRLDAIFDIVSSRDEALAN